MSAAELPYERAIVETFVLDGQRVMRILPVDGIDIFDQEGRRVWCWNALRSDDRLRLIGGDRTPVVDAGSETSGATCDRLARVAVEFIGDEAPGPRFYCLRCAADRASALNGGPSISELLIEVERLRTGLREIAYDDDGGACGYGGHDGPRDLLDAECPGAVCWAKRTLTPPVTEEASV